MKQTVLAILVGACAGLLAFVAAVNNSRQKQAAPRVPRPDASPSLDFQYFPGEPKGYAGYTDHVSMQQTVNDDLVEHDADWQFSRIGFAKGFLRTVLRRADRSPSAPGIFRMEGVSEDDAMTIEWIARMQTDGIDNASPSTSNVKSIVGGMASDIASTGPRRSTFGSRAGVDGREGLERDEISAERLRELTKLMRDAERRGASRAAHARIVPRQSRGRGTGDADPSACEPCAVDRACHPACPTSRFRGQIAAPALDGVG